MKPPSMIDEMEVRGYVQVSMYRDQLKKYMQAIPYYWLLVYEPSDKSYSIIGTDEHFGNWEQYSFYVFKTAEEALESYFLFKLPELEWKKV